MIKQSHNGSSGSKTLSQEDKEMGLQLLLSPKATVNIHSPAVAHELSHLYPKLAGPNWTCYITGDVIRLGRKPEHKPSSSNNNSNNSNKSIVDVDFCGNKQISRRHADIKFNTKKNYWELRVYGRIGVKVNHNLITKNQHPVPLTAMAHLDIGGNGFVFVLPDHTDGKPGKGDTKSTVTSTTSPPETILPASPTTTTTITTATTTTTNSQPENENNDQLVAILVDVFESLTKETRQLTTEKVFKNAIQLCRKKSLDSSKCTMDTVLRALIFDSQFKVAKECLEMTAEQSDKVQWCWQPPPLSSPEKAATTPAFDASNSDAWSDIGYDYIDENLSVSEPPTLIESGSWVPSNISETTTPTPTTTSIRQLSSTTTTTPAQLSSSTPAQLSASTPAQLSASTPATNISSPTLSYAHPAAENETFFSTMTSAPFSQSTSTTIPSIISSSPTTSATVPSIQSSSVNQSFGERTLSNLSNMDNLSCSSPIFADSEPFSDRTPWMPLELYHITSFSGEQHDMPGYSRGLSLFHMYSSISAARRRSNIDLDGSSSFATPCSLFPTTPGDDQDELDLICSNRKRKRSSTSDSKDGTLWTRFRTTVFKYKE